MPYLIPLDFRRPDTPQESKPAPQPSSAGKEPKSDVSVVGIEARTRITTSFGDVPAHLLRVNDSVRTVDGRFLKIRSIDALRMDAEFLKYHPESQPVRIRSDALGPGRPQRDVYVAPDQVIGTAAAGTCHGGLTARELLHRPRVLRDPGESVVYILVDVGEPAMVLSEKIWLEIG